MRFRHRSSASILAIAAALTACAGLFPSENGAPCGRAQHAVARAILPDTGIDARRELQVVFIQHDPDLAGELAEVAVQTAYPAATVPDPEPDPRVRLVRDDGRVLLDTLASRYDQPTGAYSRPTWMVHQWIRDAGRRNALFEAMRDQTLWIELWRKDATQPGSRVQLRTESAEVTPAMRCL